MATKTIDGKVCDTCGAECLPSGVAACIECGKDVCPACEVVTVIEISRGGASAKSRSVQCPACAAKGKIPVAKLSSVLAAQVAKA